MDGYTIQTHSVYRDKRSGTRLLLVHHDPMTLRSLLLHGDSAAFATADPQPFSVDMIIAMRRSDDFEELPRLPENEFAAILHDLIGHVSPDDRPFVQSLIDQLETERSVPPIG